MRSPQRILLTVCVNNKTEFQNNNLEDNLEDNEQKLTNNLEHSEKTDNENNFMASNNSLLCLQGIKQYFSISNSNSNTSVKDFRNKIYNLLEIFRHFQFQQCVIFCNHQDKAEALTDALNQFGSIVLLKVLIIH